MMKELVMKEVYKLGEDAEYYVSKDTIRVTIQDFVGFDEDWNEIDREYDEEKVAAFYSWLKEHCIGCECDYYKDYIFDGFVVRVGYESYDI